MAEDVFRELVKREALESREVVERIDYTHALLTQLHYCQLALSLGGWESVGNAVVALMMMLETEADEQFSKEIEASTFVVSVWTGMYAKDVGSYLGSPAKIYRIETRYDYMGIFRACISLMNRRGLLLHERKEEEIL